MCGGYICNLTILLNLPYDGAGVVAQDVTVLMNVLRRRNVEHRCKKGNPTIGEVRKKKEI
jgi:hypothetical protein